MKHFSTKTTHRCSCLGSSMFKNGSDCARRISIWFLFHYNGRSFAMLDIFMEYSCSCMTWFWSLDG